MLQIRYYFSVAKEIMAEFRLAEFRTTELYFEKKNLFIKYLG